MAQSDAIASASIDDYFQRHPEFAGNPDLMEEAHENHFIELLGEFESWYETMTSDGQMIIVVEDYEDCLDRQPDDPEYRTCCHKRHGRFIYMPDFTDHTKFSLDTTASELEVLSGRYL